MLVYVRYLIMNVLQLTIAVSSILSAVAFFGMLFLFADSLFLRFELKTFLKSLGFVLLGSAALLSLFKPEMLLIPWTTAGGFTLLFIAFIIDAHSRVRFLFPLPVLLIFFLHGHILFALLSLLTALAIFQLVYTTKHNDMIPLGIAFVLITVGEYFYNLQSVEGLKTIAVAGAFLYLFASGVLLFWIWTYLAIRMIYLLRSIHRF